MKTLEKKERGTNINSPKKEYIKKLSLYLRCFKFNKVPYPVTEIKEKKVRKKKINNSKNIFFRKFNNYEKI